MFLTGEFSKISQVSKRLLHYYDEIGLLKPAHIDPMTGYRYYSANQLPRLNRILALKELGLTLEQIARMLQSDVSDEEIHGMLLMKKAEMEQTLMDDIRRLRTIEARLEQNRAGENLPDVVLKSVPDHLFLSTRTVFSSLEEMQKLVFYMQRTLPLKVGEKALGPMAAVIYSENFIPPNSDIEFGFLLKKRVNDSISLSEEHILQMSELPAVPTMATAVQKGDPSLIFNAFGALGRWIETNGYRMMGPYREIGFEFSHPVEEMMVELQVPVEKIETSSNLLRQINH